MAGQADVNIVSIAPGDPGGDNKQLFMFKAPTDSKGGGISIQSASAVNGAATAGGTSFTLQLLKYSTAGTPAVNGTITTTAIGGSTDDWAASVPKDFTINTPFVDAGEYVVVDYQEETAGNPTNLVIQVHYIMGK